MKLNRCPLCFFKGIKKGRGVCELTVKGRVMKTPPVEHWKCPRCGEIFFDGKACDTIERALPHARV